MSIKNGDKDNVFWICLTIMFCACMLAIIFEQAAKCGGV